MWPQLLTIVLLFLSVIIGGLRLALGVGEAVPTAINAFWALFSVVMLWSMVDAVRYRPAEE